MSTPRLAIESIGPEHIDLLLAYHQRNEKHLARWEPSRSSDFFTRYWSSAAAVQDDAYQLGARAPLRRDAARLAATVASVNVTNDRGVRRLSSRRAGYSVDVAHQARGYGSESVGAIVTWCFRNLGLHRMEANYQRNNERSGRLLRSLGFAVEGYARDYLFIDGAWRDHVLTAKIRDDPPHRGESREPV